MSEGKTGISKIMFVVGFIAAILASSHISVLATTQLRLEGNKGNKEDTGVSGATGPQRLAVPAQPPPNIIITSVVPFKTVIAQNSSLNISVTVQNLIIDPASIVVRVSVNASATEVNAGFLIMYPGENATIILSWNTTGFAMGSYLIIASAIAIIGSVPNPTAVLADGNVIVTKLCDVNGDGSVDMADLSMMIDWFMTAPPNWNSNCDVNDDLSIDMADIQLAIDHFMQT